MGSSGDPQNLDSQSDPPVARPPVLDYEPPQPDPLLLGQPIGRTARQLLIGEIVLLFLTSLILDAGASMRLVAITTGACWIALAVASRFKRIRPRWTVRVMFWAGILLAALTMVVWVW